MYIKKTLICVLFAFLLLASKNVYAYRIGNFETKLVGGISETYDDNITYTKTNRKKDIITTPSVGVDIEYEDKNKILSLTGNVKQEIFADNNKFNNTAEDLNLDLSAELSKNDYLTLTDEFSHSEEPQSFEDAFGRTSGRYSHFVNRFKSEYGRSISKQLKIKAKFDNDMDYFTGDDVPALEDSFQNKVGFELDYSFSSKLFVLMLYDFTMRNFEGGESARTHSVAGGSRYYLTKQLYFDCRAGGDFIDSFGGKEYLKPLVYTAISGDLDRNTNVSLSFFLGSGSNAYSKEFMKSWRTVGTIKGKFIERSEYKVEYFYGKGEYFDSERNIGFGGVNLELMYEITKRVKATLSYLYSQYDSNRALQGYRKNTVSVGIKAVF